MREEGREGESLGARSPEAGKNVAKEVQHGAARRGTARKNAAEM